LLVLSEKQDEYTGLAVFFASGLMFLNIASALWWVHFGHPFNGARFLFWLAVAVSLPFFGNSVGKRRDAHYVRVGIAALEHAMNTNTL
jgi:hypothetical protein